MTPFLEELFAALEPPPTLAQAEAALQASLRQRHIFFGDALLPTYVTPFVVPASQLALWAGQSESLSAAVEEVATEALADRALFEALRLRPEARELLRIDPGFRRITVLSRPDAIVRDDGRLVFLEFNCDSPAMMSFADAVSASLLELPALAGLRPRLRGSDMTRALLDALTGCYAEFGGTASPPTIAITDWDGQKTRYEHRAIAAAFEAAGHPTVVCDPRAFRRSDRRLTLDGRAIDIVYRRALSNELLERQSEVEALLSAYRDGAVCMVNPLRSYVASSKALLAFLCQRAAGVRDDIADTRLIGPGAALDRRARRHVIKRAESHGGQHVLLPDLADDRQWEAALQAASREPWVMQAYHPVPQLTVLAGEGAQPGRQQKYYNWNPFLFGGRYAGGIARASDTPLINISLGGGLLPTLAIAETPEVSVR